MRRSGCRREIMHPGPGRSDRWLRHANEHPVVSHERVVLAKESQHALNICPLD